MTTSSGPFEGSKRFLDGAHRGRAPEETLRRVLPLMHRCGITRVANLTGLDRVGIPVIAAYRPDARSIAVSQGKGQTLAAARASAVMEAIEVWHAERCDVPLRRASAAELSASAAPVCDLSRLPRANTGSDGRDDRSTRRLWVEGNDLIDGSSRWCPLEVVDADYTRHAPGNGSPFLRSTNGLASGNGWSEAVSHALCELIERDAVSVWRARARRTGIPDGRVDLGSVDDPACRSLLSRYAAAGIDVGVWSVSGDVGVPTFFALIVDEATPDALEVARPANGKGCHPSKAVALSRALTEAAQSRLTYISGARDDLDEGDYDTALQRDNVRRCRTLIDDAPPVPPLDYRTLSECPGPSFPDDVAHLLGALRAVGIEQAVAIDLAADTPEVAVVRVIVPGLEGPDEHPAWVPGERALSA